jgi:hypothetical protein
MITYGPRLVLGGGFVRSTVSGEKPNDIDLFTQSAEDAKLFAGDLAGAGKRKKPPYETGNALSVKLFPRHLVQYIHRWTYSTPWALLESFDFTIACSAIWFESGKWTSLIDDEFYSDLAAKRLTYRSPIRNEDSAGSLLRLLKFYARGFRVPLDSLGAIIARAVKGLDTNQAEQELGNEITRRMRVVDPAVDPTHEAHLPASGNKEGTTKDES